MLCAVRADFEYRGLGGAVCGEAFYFYFPYVGGLEIENQPLLVVAPHVRQNPFRAVRERRGNCEVSERLRLRALYDPLHESGFEGGRKQPRARVEIENQLPDFLRRAPFERQGGGFFYRCFPAVAV